MKTINRKKLGNSLNYVSKLETEFYKILGLNTYKIHDIGDDCMIFFFKDTNINKNNLSSIDVDFKTKELCFNHLTVSTLQYKHLIRLIFGKE